MKGGTLFAQVLPGPVPFEPPESQRGHRARDRENGDTHHSTHRPRPPRQKRNHELWSADKRHLDRITRVAVAAPGAMATVRCMDIAHRIRAYPQGAAAAREHPTAASE